MTDEPAKPYVFKEDFRPVVIRRMQSMYEAIGHDIIAIGGAASTDALEMCMFQLERTEFPNQKVSGIISDKLVVKYIRQCSREDYAVLAKEALGHYEGINDDD